MRRTVAPLTTGPRRVVLVAGIVALIGLLVACTAALGLVGTFTASAAIGVAEAGFALALYVILSFRTHRDDGGRRRR